MYSKMQHIKRCNENSLLKEVWEVESNRYCGECLKPLELEEEEEPSVLLYPAVILLCSGCTQIYESIFIKTGQRDVQHQSKFSFKHNVVNIKTIST